MCACKTSFQLNVQFDILLCCYIIFKCVFSVQKLFGASVYVHCMLHTNIKSLMHLLLKENEIYWIDKINK